MPLLGRVGLFALAVAAGGVPVFLWLPPETMSWLLSLYYPADQLDLTNPDLQATWLAVLALAAGLVVWLVLWIILAAASRRQRREAQAAVPPPLRALRQAMADGDPEALADAADECGRKLGDEAVGDLLAALEAGFDELTRQRVAAALYQIGRAVTAEVDLLPRR
ncbi:MAG: hypothetical protein HYU66_29545 [Armatimonadetes bacterium]|nr:hypothetical protein [Armatimonadota bacterium]